MVERFKAVGVHVFAGGFTAGVRDVMDVPMQLEKHNFGKETVEEVWELPFVNSPSAAWPDSRDCQVCYGNPRCTGFSSMTSGYSDDIHGPWAKCTSDIHELCKYGVAQDHDIVCWESVQLAYKTGKPLVDYLVKEYFVPAGYRIAHLFINAASFGNSQQRKRYFFVAYRGHGNFNIVPPVISPYITTTYDSIWSMRDRPTRSFRGTDYDADCYTDLTKEEYAVLPHLCSGFDLHAMAKYRHDKMPEMFKFRWRNRISQMPFSLHGVYRIRWLTHSPTMHSSCARMIHPTHDRPLTVGELSSIMGWPNGAIPRGKQPAALLAKGIVPAVGRWLAEQFALYLSDYWGPGDDWYSSYDPVKCMWVGGDADGALEKEIDLTRYTGQLYDRSRYEVTDEELAKHHYDAGSMLSREPSTV